MKPILPAEALSDRDHWEDVWRRVQLPRIVDPEASPGLRAFHDLFTECFGPLGRPLDLLEIGCAASAWLPYFHRHHSCNVAGVDYSSEGVRLARQNLAMQGIEGTVEVEDMLDARRVLDRQFDVVVSFGLVEHFRQPDLILRNMADYLRTGGLLITQIPNLKGLFGWSLRWFRPDLYAIHHPMSVQDLAEYHRRAGLVPFRLVGYLGDLDLGMVTTTVVPGDWPRVVRAGIATLSHHGSRAGSLLLALPGMRAMRRWLAPDVCVIFRKPELPGADASTARASTEA